MAGNSIEAGRSVTNKVSSILLTFTRGGEHSLTEISKLAGLPVSTAHRLANELASLRVLERTPDGLYRAGLSLRTIGAVNAYPPTLAERAPYVLEDLSEIARCRARLGVLQDLEVAYIEKRPDAGTVTSFTSRATLPAHPTGVARVCAALHRGTGHHPWASGIYQTHRDRHGALPPLARGDPPHAGRGLAAGIRSRRLWCCDARFRARRAHRRRDRTRRRRS